MACHFSVVVRASLAPSPGFISFYMSSLLHARFGAGNEASESSILCMEELKHKREEYREAGRNIGRRGGLYNDVSCVT